VTLERLEIGPTELETVCFQREVSNLVQGSCRKRAQGYTLLATVLLKNKGLSGVELHLACNLLRRKNSKTYKAFKINKLSV
jgi:hypothetical protein